MKNSEAPGAANRSNPKRARRIPSTKTSHQGRVSPLLPADILTLHLPRRLSTLSPSESPLLARNPHHGQYPSNNATSSCPYSRTSWKECSRKFAYRILHSPAPRGARMAPERRLDREGREPLEG